MGRYTDCLKLNLRVASLAASGRWIGRREVAASYDALAPGYDDNWLHHLQPATRTLLEQLPSAVGGTILDLGCGTGFTSEWLTNKYPAATIVAQDISEGMLKIAHTRAKHDSITFAQGDMLDFLNGQPVASVSLAVSAWAIGYSNPRKVLQRVFQTLEPGGRFAFVVNKLETLRPAYTAFRKTMQHYSGRLRALSLPRFPAAWQQLEKQARACGFKTEWHKEGTFEVCPAGEASLNWLLGTGILAGFDAMLPLASDREVAAYFDQQLKEQNEPLAHSYVMAVLKK